MTNPTGKPATADPGLPAKVQHKAAETLEAAQAKAQDGLAQAKDLADTAMTKVPPSLLSRIKHVAATIRQRPGATTAVALIVFALLRRVLSRQR